MLVGPHVRPDEVNAVVVVAIVVIVSWSSLSPISRPRRKSGFQISKNLRMGACTVKNLRIPGGIPRQSTSRGAL